MRSTPHTHTHTSSIIAKNSTISSRGNQNQELCYVLLRQLASLQEIHQGLQLPLCLCLAEHLRLLEAELTEKLALLLLALRFR